MTAKWSEAWARAFGGGRGLETWVIGLFEGEGTSCCDLKVRQYVCSGVKGEGPGGALTGWRGRTGADISNSALCQGFEKFESPMRIGEEGNRNTASSHEMPFTFI